MAKKWDDQASANRLLQQITQLMSALKAWENQMGSANAVLDDMTKAYFKQQVAIEQMNKSNFIFQQQQQMLQRNFHAKQAKHMKVMTHQDKLRAGEQARQTQEVNKRNAAYFAMQKEMVDYRHSFKDFDAGLQLLSNAMQGSLGFGGVAVGGIQGGRGIIGQTERVTQKRFASEQATRDYDAFVKQNMAAMQYQGKDKQKLLEAENLQKTMQTLLADRSRTGSAYNKGKQGFLWQMGQTQTGGGKNLSDRLGGIADFLKKHKLGVFLALGSLVALGAIIKTALDSSPMFQQMLKLWKFAIMMIFRPLGDFFGFFFRPILVLLLRKFIIPWYTTMYPVMIKLGNDLGTFVASALEWFTDVGAKIVGFFTGLGTGTFDVNALVAMLMGGTSTIGTSFIDIITSKLLPSAFASTGNTILSDSWDLFYKGISTILDTMKPFVVTAITWVGNVAKWLVGEGSNVVKFAWETLKEQMPFIKSIFKWLKDQMPNVKTLFATFMTSLEWLKTKWEQTSSALTIAYTMLKSAVDTLTMLPSRIWVGLKSLPQKIADGFMSVLTGIFDYLESHWLVGAAFKALRPHLGFAEGGRITEPIFGVGKSGKTYSFGERGSETVIPDGKGGFGGITINIQNMSGSQSDLNNLRQTILSVIQEANTRRGRI